MPLLKVQQVAEQLACSVATVYALIERRELVAVKIGAGGGGVRVRVEDLSQFIESRLTEPTERVKRTPRVVLKHLR
jgi:excisionase family DNA binding protein